MLPPKLRSEVVQTWVSSRRKFITLPGQLSAEINTKKTDFAIEDLFPDKFYVDCVNATYGLAIKLDDLPVDGSDMVTKKVEWVLKSRYGHTELDKRRVMGEMWKQFDTWSTATDLPKDTASRAEKVFKTINGAFAEPASD